MAIRGLTAEQEPWAIRIVEETVAHDHIVTIALEVEGLAVSTTQAD